MTGRRAVRLTAEREIRTRVRTRAFLVSFALQLAVLIAIVVIAGIVSDSGPQELKVATVGEEAAAIGEQARAQQEAFGADLELRSFEDRAAAERAIDAGELDAVLADGRLLTEEDPPEELVPLLRSATQQVRASEILREEGVGQASIRQALDPPPLQVAELGGEEGDGGEGIAFVGSLLLYFSIFMSGLAVASGVVEEKSTRVVEVILAAIRPVHLLAGKVVGIGLLGIGQVVVLVGAGLGFALAADVVELPATTAGTAVLVAVCFLLGYTLYASGFAVAGALVSRQEDMQSSSAPLQILLIVGYLIGQSVTWSPDSLVTTLAAFFPPFAPMVLPGLAARGELAAWELALSLALMVAATVLVLLLAARIYERAVLRMGAPLKLRQALSLAR